MSKPIGPTVPRQELGAQLRALREGAQLTREQVAKPFGWSDSKVRRIENGQVGVYAVELRAMLDLYDITDHGEELFELARQGKQRGWWVEYGPISPKYSTYIGLESAARKVSAFDLAVVNGLLQTEDYARTVIAATHPNAMPEEVERLVKLRIARQDRLKTEGAPECWSILDEGALRRAIGGPDVMRAQLEHLLELIERPNIQLQVLPFAAGAHPGTLGSFAILSFPVDTRPPAVYLEGHGGDLYLERDEDIERCTLRYTHMCATALSPAESAKLIRSVARELRGRRDNG